MIRFSKLTDYGIVLMTYFARDGGTSLHTARDLAAESQVPLPTVSKILKSLSQGGLLVSHRGVKGGYSLARLPREISVGEIVAAIEGPIAVTECSMEEPGMCDLQPHCPISRNWRVISRALREALENLSLQELIQPLHPVKNGTGSLVSLGVHSGRTQ